MRFPHSSRALNTAFRPLEGERYTSRMPSCPKSNRCCHPSKISRAFSRWSTSIVQRPFRRTNSCFTQGRFCASISSAVISGVTFSFALSESERLKPLAWKMAAGSLFFRCLAYASSFSFCVFWAKAFPAFGLAACSLRNFINSSEKFFGHEATSSRSAKSRAIRQFSTSHLVCGAFTTPKNTSSGQACESGIMIFC